MVRASAKGVIDFSRARFFDRRWWTRLLYLISEVELEDLKDLVELKFKQHCSALNYEAGDTFKHHWERLKDLHKRWVGLTMPWLSDKLDDKKSADKVANIWKRAYGHLSKEELDKRIKITADSLKNQPGQSPEPGLGCVIGRK